MVYYGDRHFENVIITGEPKIGCCVSIGDFSEVNSKGCRVEIGTGCDIASFVAINGADSSDFCLGRSEEIQRRDITIGAHTFIGSHSFIGGGVTIGHHCKVAAGTILRKPFYVPDYSLVFMEVGTDFHFGPRVIVGCYAPAQP